MIQSQKELVSTGPGVTSGDNPTPRVWRPLRHVSRACAAWGVLVSSVGSEHVSKGLLFPPPCEGQRFQSKAGLLSPAQYPKV